MNENRRVLVTGVTGFVGRHVAPALAAAGWQVRGATRTAPPAAGVAGVTEWAQVGEFDSETKWRDALVSVDAVVHLAALAHHTDPRRQPTEEDFLRVNAEGTRRLADAARQSGTVRRFVALSSIGAVTDASEAPIDDSTPPRPVMPYGRSKLAGERALAETLRESTITWCALRPVLIYGPGNPGNMARLLRLVRTGVPLPLAGIRNRRSFAYVGNVADALVAALHADDAAIAGRAFVLADPETVSTPELLRQLAGASGRRARLWSCPTGLLRLAARGGDLAARLGLRTGLDSYSLRKLEESLAVSAEGFTRATGWTARVSLPEGLRRTLVDSAAR